MRIEGGLCRVRRGKGAFVVRDRASVIIDDREGIGGGLVGYHGRVVGVGD